MMHTLKIRRDRDGRSDTSTVGVRGVVAALRTAHNLFDVDRRVDRICVTDMQGREVKCLERFVDHCEGHEGTTGATMGQTTFCDGTCQPVVEYERNEA